MYQNIWIKTYITYIKVLLKGRDETKPRHFCTASIFFPPVERRELTESVTDVRRMCTTSCSNFCKYLAVGHIDRIPKSLVRRNLPRGQCESRLIDLFRNSSLFLCGFEAHTFVRSAKLELKLELELELKSGLDVGRPGEGSSAWAVPRWGHDGCCREGDVSFSARWVAGMRMPLPSRGGGGGALSPSCLTELLYNSRALTSNHRLWKLTFPFKLLQSPTVPRCNFFCKWHGDSDPGI